MSGSRNEQLLQAIIDDESLSGFDQSRNERILQSIIDESEYTDDPQSRIESLLLQLKEKIESGGGGSELLDALLDGSITEISSDVATLHEGAFWGCNKLVTANLPNLRSIPDSCFAGCTKLTSVNLGDSGGYNRTVPSNAFYNCTSLVILDLKKTCTDIAKVAFSGATNFNTLIIRNPSMVCRLGATTAFNNTKFASGKTGGTLYVPQSLVSSYQTATNWKTLWTNNTFNQVKAIEGSIYE